MQVRLLCRLYLTAEKSIAEGALYGGAFGAAAGALIGLAPTIGTGLGAMMSGTASAGAVALTSSYVLAAGATAALGLSIAFAQWTPGSWPGDDPTQSPGDGFEWRGQNPIGADRGAWYNPSTGESLHPDFNHPGMAPHWDWTDSNRVMWRIFRLFIARK